MTGVILAACFSGSRSAFDCDHETIITSTARHARCSLSRDCIRVAVINPRFSCSIAWCNLCDIRLKHIAIDAFKPYCPCSLAAPVAIAGISLSIAVITMHLNITAPAIAVIADRIYVCCCMKLYYVFAMNSNFCIIAASNSSSIGMQWSRSLQRSGPKKRLLLRANAAEQRHNVGFVLVDGEFEGGVAVTAGRRVSGNHENNTTQNQ